MCVRVFVYAFVRAVASLDTLIVGYSGVSRISQGEGAMEGRQGEGAREGGKGRVKGREARGGVKGGRQGEWVRGGDKGRDQALEASLVTHATM